MAREDDMLRQWFDMLRILQDCASNLNSGTQSDLATFYSQKHCEVLSDDNLRQSFASCVFTRTGFSVTADDFAHTSNFHELLDSAFRPLRVSVRALWRSEGIKDGTVPSDMDPIAFEAMKTTAVYPSDAARQALMARLAAGMPTLTAGPQADLLRLLAKAETTAGKAIDSVL
jgi:hypothetical protein